MENPRYRQIQSFLKSQIQKGIYKMGDYLPSENQLCLEYKITRTTARKALEELLHEGFIERQHGIGSMVRDRSKSLGLLNLKGFSEAVGSNVKTIFLQKPGFRMWNLDFPFRISELEQKTHCIHFERIRCVGDEPVILENNWFSEKEVPGFVGKEFVNSSFFKTLSQRYLIEITGSEQELRALPADEKTALVLGIDPGSPVLRILIHFSTSRSNLNIYSVLFCNTLKYPVGNSYFL